VQVLIWLALYVVLIAGLATWRERADAARRRRRQGDRDGSVQDRAVKRRHDVLAHARRVHVEGRPDCFAVALPRHAPRDTERRDEQQASAG